MNSARVTESLQKLSEAVPLNNNAGVAGGGGIPGYCNVL